MRSTEPLLSTHPLTEPRKGDRFCVVLQWKEMLLVLDLCCIAPDEIPTGNHFLHSNQSMNTRPCCGGLKDQQPNSPRQRLGFCMPCVIPPRRGISIPPTIKLLPCQSAVCYVTLVAPGCCPRLVAQCPFSGAHSAIRFVDCDTTEEMPLGVRLCIVLRQIEMMLGR